MKRAPRSLQHHVLYRKYNGQDSEISALLGKCGLKAISDGTVPTANRGRTPLLRADLPDLDFWVGKRVSFERPWFRRHLRDVKSATSLVSSWVRGITEKTESIGDDVEDVVTQRSGTSEDSVKEILGHQAFSFPKPPSLFRELLRYATDANDVVLDFFAGSGTTAQAVLALNAEDDGNRRFILVSSREMTKENPDRNLCREVCAERVRRVIEGYSGVAGLGGNFAYLVAKRLDFEDMAYDLKPEHVWLAIQAIHGLPLSPLEPDKPLQVAVDHSGAVAYCDRFNEAAEQQAMALSAAHPFVVIYAYAPGRLRDVMRRAANTEVRALPDYLIKRFQG